jgi:5-methylcytosine-specific restriction endonuclease McrA
LETNKAAIFRRFPFTIILKRAVDDPKAEPVQLKLDPGSKTTGITLVQGEKVVWAAELTHRGQSIHNSLTDRRAIRRGRRNRKTRYRQPRYQNRRKPEGWLAPSLLHRVQTIVTWVKRLCRLAPVTGISQELVKFDLQQIQNPEISGVEYQQGELAGYEVREYLLEKWQRRCSYCSAQNIPLEVEHIQPISRAGTNRIANLCLACHACNQKKGNQPVEQLLAGKPEVLKRVLAQAKTPLKDAAAVNATRKSLLCELQKMGLPVEVASGGRTKWNRTRLGLEKAHWRDAACVGEVQTLTINTSAPLLIACVGHGSRQVCRTDKYGFPNRHKTRTNQHYGFETGDMVKAVVTTGKKIGIYVGKVACRATGSFNISTLAGLVQGIGHRFCQVLHRKDGYAYY